MPVGQEPRTRVILRRVKMRPRQIVVFIGLQCGSLALGAVKLPMDWSHLRTHGSVASILFILLFTIAIVAFLIWKVSRGRNWARITLLVFFVIGLLPFYFTVRSELGRSTSLGMFSILQAAL